jgi:hypothetical protein
MLRERADAGAQAELLSQREAFAVDKERVRGKQMQDSF